MKKILFAAAAIVAMASCATDDVVSRPAGAAIEFNDAFVENATRANDIAKDNLSQFNVYGSVTANNTNGFIFTDQLVEKNGDYYTYTPAQYWIPAASYKFTAFASLTANQRTDNVARQWSFAPAADAANGVISFNNEVAQANQDLVYAYADCTTPETIASKPAPVAFTFNHMLSRVRFTFANGFQSAGNIKLAVSNVHIIDAYANGTLAVENGTPAAAWAPANKTLDVTFGDAAETIIEGAKQSTEHFYLIPNSEATTYAVTFDVTLYQAGVEIDTYSHVVEFTCAMNRGMSYDIKTTLTPENTSDDDSVIYPIEFTVIEVEDWANYADVALEAKTVATAAELTAAVAEGGDVRLTQDIALPTDGLAVNANASIDLNGYTLTVAESNFVNNATLVVSNGTISGSNTQVGRRAIVNKGNLTMNNVTVAQVYEAGGSAINNDGATAVAVLNNVTVLAENMGISNKNGATMTINGGNFVGNGKGASYAIVNQLGSTMTINGGTFEGGHGVVSSTENSVTTLNAGTFHCTCTYTGNSDWVLYTSFASGDEEPGTISYNEANCTFTTARTDGKIYHSTCESHITKF